MRVLITHKTDTHFEGRDELLEPEVLILGMASISPTRVLGFCSAVGSLYVWEAWGQTSTPKQTQARAISKSQAEGRSFRKRSRTAGKIRSINRIIRLWVWHSFLHAQIKRILVVSPRTRLNQLLADFPCGPAAGNGDSSCLLVGAEWKQCGLGPRPSETFKGVLSCGSYWSLRGDHRRWGCNELVKLLAVPVTGDYIREIHIKCVFISHPSPQ